MMMGRFGGSDWDQMVDFMEKTHGSKMWGGSFFWQLHSIFGFVTWLLIIVLLIVLIRYFWKKGGK